MNKVVFQTYFPLFPSHKFSDTLLIYTSSTSNLNDQHFSFAARLSSDLLTRLFEGRKRNIRAKSLFTARPALHLVFIVYRNLVQLFTCLRKLGIVYHVRTRGIFNLIPSQTSRRVSKANMNAFLWWNGAIMSSGREKNHRILFHNFPGRGKFVSKNGSSEKFTSQCWHLA